MMNPYEREQMQYMRAMQREQQNQMRLAQKQQAQMIREYQRQVAHEEKERQRLDMQYSRYPKLTDKFIRECIAEEIYRKYMLRGMRVPEPTVLITKLKFRRIKAETPEGYVINGRNMQLIKHACKFNGVSFNQIQSLRIVYRSPVAERYNHDYGYVLPYFYCSQCKSVIYYFND